MKPLPLLFALLLCGLFSLRAQTPSPAFVLPQGEPVATLTLPEGLKAQEVSLAVSKALVAQEWENLGWEGNLTTATTVQSKITIKLYAQTTATEVKFFASFSSEKNVPEEKSRQIALRQLRPLEKSIAEALGLAFRKGKGETNVVDQAVRD